MESVFDLDGYSPSFFVGLQNIKQKTTRTTFKVRSWPPNFEV